MSSTRSPSKSTKAKAPKSDPWENPFYSNGELVSGPKLFERALIDKFYVSGNDKPTPEQLLRWAATAMEKARKDGVKKLFIQPFEEQDDDELPDSYIGLYGDRMETEEEHKNRIQRLRSDWLRRYEDHLRQVIYYNSKRGRAEVQEALKAGRKVSAIREDARPEVLAELAKERARLETAAV